VRREDSALIKRFVDAARGMERLCAIVLFGSMARGEEEKHSDIDVLLVFDEDSAESRLKEVVSLVTELKGHREIQPVLTNLRDMDVSFLQNVFKEGKVLWVNGEWVLKLLSHRPYSIFSYDLSGLEPAKKTEVSRFLYGYRVTKSVRGDMKEYVYRGAGESIGPAALVEEKDSLRVKRFLEDMDVRYRERKIWL